MAQRDIQFEGFAHTELEKIFQIFKGQGATWMARAVIQNQDKLRLILAQCAYDLVQHTLSHHKDIQDRPLGSIDIAEINDTCILVRNDEVQG